MSGAMYVSVLPSRVALTAGGTVPLDHFHRRVAGGGVGVETPSRRSSDERLAELHPLDLVGHLGRLVLDRRAGTTLIASSPVAVRPWLLPIV